MMVRIVSAFFLSPPRSIITSNFTKTVDFQQSIPYNYIIKYEGGTNTMSAYSDWKCGAISEEEYDDYCRWEDARDHIYEPADYYDDYDEEEECY